MAVIPLPYPADEILWVRKIWRLDQPSQVNRSRWSGATKIVRLPGASRWLVSATLAPMTTENQVKPWRAFFASLEGQGHVFDVPAACNQATDPDIDNAVAGATQTDVDGLVAGDYVTFAFASGRRQMVMLTYQNDGHFMPHLRENSTSAEGENPYCRMRLAGSDIGWDEEQGVFSISFDAEEAT